MVLVEAREGTHSVGRKKLRFVQHAAEDALELFAIHEGKKPADAARGTLRHFDVLGHIRMIVDEPLHAALEAGKTIDDFRLESLDREKRDQSDHRPDFQKVFFAVREFQHVIKKNRRLHPKVIARRRLNRLWRGRYKRNARRTCWRRLRKQDPLSPAPERWPACSGNTYPSNWFRQTVRGGLRWEVARSGQRLRYCRGREIRLEKCLRRQGPCGLPTR